MITLAKKLISIESTKEKPENLSAVLDVAKNELSSFKPKLFSKNKVPSLLCSNKNTKSLKVILNGHLDVVPGNKKLFKPFVKGGRLYGRGAIDMKSAAAVLILVFKELAGKVDYPLGLQLVTDEEIGGFKGTKYQLEKGIRSEFVIAGEPTSFDIGTQAKGIFWFKVKAKGKSSHGSLPWEGENAIQKINNFINILNSKYPSPKNEKWASTFNLSKIETDNNTFNKVPDNCVVWFDCRYVPKDSDAIIKNVKRLLPKDLQLEVQLKEPSQFTDRNNQFVKNLKLSTEKVTRKTINFINKHGASDLRHCNAYGVNGVVFGPIGEGLHAETEWVDLKSLETYYEILKHYLLSLNS
jgi:succinyl-diaminopimelate desuccinylase